LQVAASKVNGTVKRPRRCEIVKRRTAMISCANKKKRGAAVELNTHLFLRRRRSDEVNNNHVVQKSITL
jgi:hypothetical protein